MLKNKKGNVQVLQSVALAIITLAIVVGIGLTLVVKLGDSVVTCDNEAATTSITDEEGWINKTGYTLDRASTQGFSGLTGVTIINASDETTILAGNYTMSSAGVLTNITTIAYDSVKINYTYSWTDTHTWNSTTQTCLNATGADATTGLGTAYTGLAYAATQLGSTGLLSWLPAIIALIVGIFFLVYFMGKKNY